MLDHDGASVLSRETCDAVIFDLDGVITDTASVHAWAWKRTFDTYLEARTERLGTPPEPPFNIDRDYKEYVDGKPRYKGVRSFLESRGIDLPEGTPEDGPEEETVCGVGNCKNTLFNRRLGEKGADIIPGAIEFIYRVRAQGIKTALVTSSRNCATIMESIGMSDLFSITVDGLEAARLNLKGKPEADAFLEAARRLRVAPARAAIVEDAISGVQAGRNGGFGVVIGVVHDGNTEALMENGATVVIDRLTEIEVEGPPAPERMTDELPSALESVADMLATAGKRKLAFFLDYDGTMTPIVARPELAVMAPEMRNKLKAVAGKWFVAVVSGRDLNDVKGLVQMDGLYYAGSHGFDIERPDGAKIEAHQGAEFLPVLAEVEGKLRTGTEEIEGALIERKKFSIAVHYRLVESDDEVARMDALVDRTIAEHRGLRKGHGKKVWEVQPDIKWHKGKAVLHLVETLKLDPEKVLPVFVGDDITDEDAFRALAATGLGIVVKDDNRPTAARYALESVDEVEQFFDRLVDQA